MGDALRNAQSHGKSPCLAENTGNIEGFEFHYFHHLHIPESGNKAITTE